MFKIPFNKISYSGYEIDNMRDAAIRGQLSGSGYYSGCCEQEIGKWLNTEHVLLTTSCSHALELAASLIDFVPGDEIIIPAYNFVTSASSFVAKGARVVWADSDSQHPNMAFSELDRLYTPNTKAVVLMHYGGSDAGGYEVRQWCDERGIILVEDVAHGFGARDVRGKPLGSYGHLSAFSFHDSKNITCGEGGALVINDERFLERARVRYDKGTNRALFNTGKASYYEWCDLGASYTLAELNAAFLLAQLKHAAAWTASRQKAWEYYAKQLTDNEVYAPILIKYDAHNAHNFCIKVSGSDNTNALLKHLHQDGIQALSHYRCLSKSPYARAVGSAVHLPNAESWEQLLIRLPLYNTITAEEQDVVVRSLLGFVSQVVRYS